MCQRSFQSLEHDVRTGLDVAFQPLSQLCNLLGSVDISGSAACDNTFLYGCTSSCQSIFHTKLCFFHLGLGCSTYTDHCYAAGQFCQTLLQFLSVEIGGRLVDLMLDLSHTILDRLGLACTVYDHGIFLLYLYALCTAQLLQSGLFQIQTQLLADHFAAGQDSDILQHFFSSVAVARCLNRYYIESTTQLVYDQGGQSLAFYIFCDDEQTLAGLYDLLQDRQDVLDVADLLIGDQDVRIFQNGFHLVHIGCHISGDVTTVELHTFYQFQLGLHGLGFLDGDHTVVGNLLHSICYHVTHFFITCRDSSNLGDLLFAFHLGAHLLDCFYCALGSLLHTLSHNDRICACCQVLHAFVYHSLCQYGCGSGTVTCCIVGLGSDFLYQLCTHVFKSIFQLDLFCDGHTVVCDQRSTIALIQYYVSSLRP